MCPLATVTSEAYYRVRHEGILHRSKGCVVVLMVVCFVVEFCVVCTLCTFSYFSYVRVTEWPPFGKWLLCSAYDMFCHLGFLKW